MNKYCTISDLHIGCHCDSEHWHTILLNWGKWLKDELCDKNIDNIIICGDFFDNRSEIGVKTISVAGELMDMWSDFNVTMITGNHDMFYKNRTDVNSVSIFEGRSNVDVISTITTKQIGDKTVTYIPWGQDLQKCPKSDIIFGHLEINGFKMMPGKLAEGKTPPKSLTGKAKLTFSGHFHLRDERQYLNSKIIYIGSPYQLNWGESTNVPGYYVVDVDAESYEFHENTISPKHIKLDVDDLDVESMSGNIVSVDIDPTMDDVEIEGFKSKIYAGNPLEVKFNTIRNIHNVDSDVECESNVDILEVMTGFVDDMKLENHSNAVKDKLKELYGKYVK